MTTIAWDGSTLAGDRRGNAGGMAYEVCKLRRTADGRLLGFSGEIGVGTLMLDWLDRGGPRPAAQDSDRWATLLEIEPDGSCWCHGRDGRWRIEQGFFAIGSGRDFALAAMAMGADAAKAVEVAARFDTGTGNGVDALRLQELVLLREAA
jgi:20S proteasome alpha/beta subunit